MVMIATSVEFEAAHRQYGDHDKCGYLHGHNWRVDFVLQGDVQNSVGYLVNFSDLKKLVAGLDHKVILVNDDPLIPILQEAGQRVVAISLNPTCENLSEIILQSVIDTVRNDTMTFIGVTVWENGESRATSSWTRDKDEVK